MTTHVDKTRTGGSNDGTSWPDAFLSIVSATGVAAGEEIWLDDGHTEDFSTNTILTFTNGTDDDPVILLSIDSADDTLSPGAKINTDAGNWDLTINGAIEVDGVDIFATDDVLINQTPFMQKYKNGTLELGAGSSPSLIIGKTSLPGHTEIDNCVMKLLAFSISVNRSHKLRILNTDIQGSAAVLFSLLTSEHHDIYLESCDLTDYAALVTWDIWRGRLHVNRCALKTGYTAGDAVTGTENNTQQEVIVERSEPGTNVDTPISLKEYHNYAGSIISVTSQYRTGGADDGQQVNAYSWKMVSNGNAKELYRPLEASLLVKRVDGGSSLTFDVFIAGGGTLQDDDFAIRLEGPSNVASPNETAQGFSTTTLIAPRTSPANITTDGVSAWNGTGVGTKQKLSIAYTPSEEGPVTITPMLFKPNTTVYVDAKMAVT